MNLSSKPRLTLDIGPLLEDQWTGIPVFTRRLVQALQRTDKLDLDFCVRLTRIPRSEVEDTLRLGAGTFLRNAFETQGFSRFDMVDPSIPILYPSVKSSPNNSGREASTIHDMSTLMMPETHDAANIHYHMDPLREQLGSDEQVFCVSEATRQALLLAFPSVAERARVLYQYVDWPDEFALYDRNLPPIALGRYAIVIGTIEPRKNLVVLLRALEHASIATRDLTFVVIGKRGWRVDEALADLKPEAQKKIKFTGFVTEFVKYRLLKSAQFLVFPSVYEGFGIPAVEAMSLGKPVLGAMTSAFPEVIGDAGLFFDPFSVTELVAGLKEIDNGKLLEELSPRAFEQAATFHWQRMAEPVIDWLL